MWDGEQESMSPLLLLLERFGMFKNSSHTRPEDWQGQGPESSPPPDPRTSMRVFLD